VKRSPLAVGAALIVVIAALFVAGRAIYSRLPSRTRHTPDTCLVPVEVVERVGSRLACANDDDLKLCGVILNAGDRVTLVDGGCKVGRGEMHAAMRLAEGLRLNLNTASARDLALIEGVDPVTAARIVAVRDARGPFASIGDLDTIEGVGPETLSRLRATCEVLP
jgi:competence ComEA-like helix-hairpin-helix protein